MPCKLSLNISAEGMELKWYRDKPSLAVHVYKNGEDVYDEQMTEYKGRTSFNGSRVAEGEGAVKIHNVTVFDNGTYHCVFKEHTSHSQATLWLKVAGEGWCRVFYSSTGELLSVSARVPDIGPQSPEP